MFSLCLLCGFSPCKMFILSLARRRRHMIYELFRAIMCSDRHVVYTDSYGEKSRNLHLFCKKSAVPAQLGRYRMALTDVRLKFILTQSHTHTVLLFHILTRAPKWINLFQLRLIKNIAASCFRKFLILKIISNKTIFL